MSFYVVGDPHYKDNNIEETNLMELSILDELSKIQVDAIVLLGDILDKHQHINSLVQVRAIKFIEKLMKISHVYVLIGNHDMKNNSMYMTEDHGFYGLKSWKGVKIVDHTIVDVIKGEEYMFVPYVPKGRFAEALIGFNLAKVKVIFAHQEFKGCKMGIIESEDGDPWPLDYPKVVTGHIHDFQIPQDNILYLGTPIQHSYCDTARRYTLHLMIINGEITMNLIELKNVIKKKIVHMNSSDLEKVVVKPLDPNTKVRIKVDCKIEQLGIIEKHPVYLKLKSLGYDMILVPTGSISLTTKFTNEKTFMDLVMEELEKENLLDFYKSLNLNVYN